MVGIGVGTQVDRRKSLGIDAAPVQFGDTNGELVAVDLRGNMAIAEYRTGYDDRRWVVFLTLVVLNLLDVISTAAVLSSGGAEFNPIMQPIAHDTFGVLATKVLVLVIIGGILARMATHRRADIALSIATGWYVAVVAWNLTILSVI